MPNQIQSKSWIFDFVTMVAVLVGLTFGAIELRQLRNTQESQVLIEFYNTYQTPEYVRGGMLLLDLPDDISPDEVRSIMQGENRVALRQQLFTFEGIGLMVFRGDVSIEVVDQMFRYAVTSAWRKLRPWIIEERDRIGYSNSWEWFQWLAERLEERSNGEVPVPAYELYRDWRE